MGCSHSSSQNIPKTSPRKEPSTKKTLWLRNVQRPCDNFTGRTDLLKEIADACVNPGSKLAIVGPSGIGKTELAREFAYSNVHGYTKTILIDCASIENELEALAKLTKVAFHPTKNQLGATFQKIFGKFSDNGESILFIFDNWDNSYANCLPQTVVLQMPPTIILIGFSAVPSVPSVQVDGLLPREGAEYLRRYAENHGLPLELGTAEAFEQLGRLSERIAGHPSVLKFIAPVIFHNLENSAALLKRLEIFMKAVPECNHGNELDYDAIWDATVKVVKVIPGGAHAVAVLCAIELLDPEHAERQNATGVWADAFPHIDITKSLRLLQKISFISYEPPRLSYNDFIASKRFLHFLEEPDLLSLLKYLSQNPIKLFTFQDEDLRWDYFQDLCTFCEWTRETWSHYLFLCFDARVRELPMVPFQDCAKRRIKSLEMDHPELSDLRCLIFWSYEGALFSSYNIEKANMWVKGESFAAKLLQLVTLFKMRCTFERLEEEEETLVDEVDAKLMAKWLVDLVQLDDLPDLFGHRVKYLFEFLVAIKRCATERTLTSKGWAWVWKRAFKLVRPETEEYYWNGLSEMFRLTALPKSNIMLFNEFSSLMDAMLTHSFPQLLMVQLMRWNRSGLLNTSSGLDLLNVAKMMTLTSSTGTNPFLQCPGFLKALSAWSSRAMMENDDEMTYAHAMTWYALATASGSSQFENEAFIREHFGVRENVKTCVETLEDMNTGGVITIHRSMPTSWDFRIDYAFLKAKTYGALLTPFLCLLQIQLLQIVEPILNSTPEGAMFVLSTSIAGQHLGNLSDPLGLSSRSDECNIL